MSSLILKYRGDGGYFVSFVRPLLNHFGGQPTLPFESLEQLQQFLIDYGVRRECVPMSDFEDPITLVLVEELLSGMNKANERIPLVMDDEGDDVVIGMIGWRPAVSTHAERYIFQIDPADVEPQAQERLIRRWVNQSKTKLTCGGLNLYGTVSQPIRRTLSAGNVAGVWAAGADEYVEFVLIPDHPAVFAGAVSLGPVPANPFM